jgi:hypothetical protein
MFGAADDDPFALLGPFCVFAKSVESQLKHCVNLKRGHAAANQVNDCKKQPGGGYKNCLPLNHSV